MSPSQSVSGFPVGCICNTFHSPFTIRRQIESMGLNSSWNVLCCGCATKLVIWVLMANNKSRSTQRRCSCVTAVACRKRGAENWENGAIQLFF